MKKSFLVLGLSLFLVGCANESKNNQKSVNEEHETSQLSKDEEYIEDLITFSEVSYELALDSETVGNGYIDTWHTTIFDDQIEIDGVTYTDFNDSLAAQEELFDKNLYFDLMNLKSNELKALYSNLKEDNNKKYEEEFESAKQFYLLVEEFKQLSININGSLESYSDSFNTLRNEVFRKHSSLKLELDLI